MQKDFGNKRKHQHFLPEFACYRTIKVHNRKPDYKRFSNRPKWDKGCLDHFYKTNKQMLLF